MKAIRRLPDSNRKVLYLTFDDGPHPGSTETILKRLGHHGIHATFFVISEKVARAPALFREIRAAGHSIGNHSLDHGYSRFFRGKHALVEWIESAESSIGNLLGEPTVGFRPPAGVRTPELYRALEEIGMPLVLWSTRFFDAVFPWTRRRAMKSLENAQSGDIIVLHDRQPAAKLPGFLRTLDDYVSAAKAAGFEFGVLTRKQLAVGIEPRSIPIVRKTNK